tara:strand:+ start:32225 stop:33046 length:822 start_codon:yes stop_codon:yes gene_type:complete
LSFTEGIEMAEIQQRIRECADGVRRSCDSAYGLLRQEWLPQVAHRLRVGRDSYEVEEVLTAVLAELIMPPPRALAPEGRTPRKWRSKVLKNAVIDILRKKISQREIERYGGCTEYSAEDVRQLRKHNARDLEIRKGKERATKAEQSLMAPVEVKSPFSEASDGHDEAVERIDRRNLLKQLMPQIGVKRRQAIAIEHGFSPWVWLEEFAADLDEPYEAVKARVGAYEHAPYDLELRARVFYPDGDATKAKNAYRKLVTNGIADLAKLASSGRSA